MSLTWSSLSHPDDGPGFWNIMLCHYTGKKSSGSSYISTFSALINKLVDSDFELLSNFLILFGDDIVLFTTDPESPQSQIDSIYHFSVKWGLEINVDKTKICVFESRKSNNTHKFFIDGREI